MRIPFKHLRVKLLTFMLGVVVMLTAATLFIVKSRMSQYVMDDLSTRLTDESTLYQRIEQVRRLQAEQAARLIADQPSLKALMSTNDRLTVQDASESILNSSGAVVGVNVQIDSESNGSEGVGFSTPIDTVKSVADTLISGGKVEHAYLGIQVGDAANDGGAQVSCVVSGSPADKAGLKAGDVITAVGTTDITTADDLTAAVNAYKPNDQVTMTVNRGGSSKSLSVTFGNRPSSASTCS